LIFSVTLAMVSKGFALRVIFLPIAILLQSETVEVAVAELTAVVVTSARAEVSEASLSLGSAADDNVAIPGRIIIPLNNDFV